MANIKGGLGKGLSALIRPQEQPARQPSPENLNQQAPPTPAAPPPDRAASINDIEISRIRPNPFQPRADFDPAALDELKQSIQQQGIIQPITVRMVQDGMYELISGERRMRASLELGLPTIPAYIIEVRSDQEMLELALVENLQREHLNPIEIAISYQRLSTDIGLTPEEIAKKVSKDRTTVINFLRLLKLPQAIQTAVRKGALTTGHARALLGIANEEIQLQLFERIVSSDMSVRQVEKLVRAIGKAVPKKGAPSTAAHAANTDSGVAHIEGRIRQLLATKVKISVRADGKGEIIIEFYNHDDLGRLFDLLSSVQQ